MQKRLKLYITSGSVFAILHFSVFLKLCNLLPAYNFSTQNFKLGSRLGLRIRIALWQFGFNLDSSASSLSNFPAEDEIIVTARLTVINNQFIQVDILVSSALSKCLLVGLLS